MKHKFFTIPILYPEPVEADLNRFCDQHRIINIEKHFVSDGSNSYWAVCVTWLAQESALIPHKATQTAKKKPRVDYKSVLNETDFQCFSELRDLRMHLAEQEGIPVYNIFTNEQLAQIVQQRITSQSALLSLNGVGQTRVEKYAEPFLDHMQQWISDETPVHQP